MKSNVKAPTRIVRISPELYEFVKCHIRPLDEHIGQCLERIIGFNNSARRFFIVGNLAFDEFESADMYATKTKAEIFHAIELSPIDATTSRGAEPR